MATTYRPPSTKVIPPPPPEYKATWDRGGWRLCERVFGARTDLHLKWQEMTGCQSRRRPIVTNATSDNVSEA